MVSFLNLFTFHFPHLQVLSTGLFQQTVREVAILSLFCGSLLCFRTIFKGIKLNKWCSNTCNSTMTWKSNRGVVKNSKSKNQTTKKHATYKPMKKTQQNKNPTKNRAKLCKRDCKILQNVNLF